MSKEEGVIPEWTFAPRRETGYYSPKPGVIHIVQDGVDLGPIEELADPPPWALVLKNTAARGLHMRVVGSEGAPD